MRHARTVGWQGEIVLVRWCLMKPIIAYTNTHTQRQICISTLACACAHLARLHTIPCQHTDTHQFTITSSQPTSLHPPPALPVPVQRNTVWHLLCPLFCLLSRLLPFCISLRIGYRGHMTNAGTPFKYLLQSRGGGIVKRKICLSTTDTDALSVLTSEKFICLITCHMYLLKI